jgi:dephospho-CoA kinase
MIFIVGHHNTGKTSLARALIPFGFLHIETGDIVRMVYQKLSFNIDFYEWASEHKHQFDDFIINEILKAKRKILESVDNLQDVIITGNRQLSGILSIIKKVPPIGKRGNVIIFLDANPKELFRRQMARKDRLIPTLSFEQFVKDFLDYDKAMGIEEIRQKADFIIDANKSKEEVFESVRKILKQRGYKV